MGAIVEERPAGDGAAGDEPPCRQLAQRHAVWKRECEAELAHAVFRRLFPAARSGLAGGPTQS